MDQKEIKKVIKETIVPYLIGIRNDLQENKGLVGGEEEEVAAVVFRGKPGKPGKDAKSLVPDVDYLTPEKTKAIIMENLPKKGKDFFTDKDVALLVKKVLKQIPPAEKGKDGVVDYSKVEVLSKNLINEKHKEYTKQLKDLVKEIFTTIKALQKDKMKASEVRDLLESLKGSERLNAKAIKGLEQFVQTIIVQGGGGSGSGSSSGSVVASFLDLTDTPSSYSGQSRKLPIVKTTEDGVEFSDGMTFNKTANLLNVNSTTSSQLVPNGDFNGTSSWTYGSGWTNTGTRASHSSNGTAALFTSSLAVLNARYRMVVDVPVLTAGSFTISLGAFSATISAAGTYEYEFTAVIANNIILSPTNTSRFEVESVYLYRLTGGSIFTSELNLATGLDTPSGGWGQAMNVTANSSTGTINNLALTTGYIVFTGGGAKTLTGMVGNANIAKHVIIENTNSGVLTISHQSSSSSVGNRFRLPGNTDFKVPVGQAVMFSYNSTDDVWTLVGNRYFFNSTYFTLSDTNEVNLTSAGLSKWTQTATTLYPTVDRKIILNGAGVDDGSGASLQVYDASSCQGTVTACSGQIEAVCNTIDGCSYQGNSCPSQPSSEDCDNTPGCSGWVADACGGDNGSPNTCPEYGDEESCNGDPSGLCNWNGSSCDGDNSVANTCGGQPDQTSCEADSCTWIPAYCSGNNSGCVGTATPCSSFSPGASCDAQPGCSSAAADAINAHGNSTFESLELNTVASKPTCSSSIRGRFWFTQSGSGVKDALEVCAKDSGNAYAWRTIY